MTPEDANWPGSHEPAADEYEPDAPSQRGYDSDREENRDAD